MKLLFWLAKSKRNKQGQVPVYCRITINGERAEISTNLWILEKEFDNRYKKIRKSHHLADSYNKTLLSITSKLNSLFHNAIFFDGHSPTSKQLKELFQKGTYEKSTHITSVLKEYICYKHKNTTTEAYKKDNRYSSLIITALAQLSYLNYNLEEYNDHIVDRLASHIIDELDYSISYCKKSLSFFKSTLLFAYNQRYFNRFPNFNKINYKETNQIIYLSDSEMKRLAKYCFSSISLEKVRDCFLMQCYTGLAYIDLRNLSTKNIIFENDGLWINTRRQKVKTAECNIPLNPLAVSILEKYNFHLPIVSNQKYNSHLKTIASLLGINKKLTTHVGRKTFATYLLNNDVPIETVSALLGHSNISITQKAYAKVLHMKVAKDVRSIF